MGLYIGLGLHVISGIFIIRVLLVFISEWRKARKEEREVKEGVREGKGRKGMVGGI